MLTDVKNGVNVWWFKILAPSLCQETNKHTKFSAMNNVTTTLPQAITNDIDHMVTRDGVAATYMTFLGLQHVPTTPSVLEYIRAEHMTTDLAALLCEL